MRKLGPYVLLAICSWGTVFTARNISTRPSQTSNSPTTLTSSFPSTAAPVTTNSTATPTTDGPTSKPVDTCLHRNSSCGECVREIRCYWCGADSTCKAYPPASRVIPRDCKGNDWYWKQCTLAGHILIYVIPSVSFVVLVMLGCCIYCLCCRNRCRRSYERDDRKLQRRREEIKQRYAERRAERKMKTDAIRQKYGLLSNEDDAEVA